MCIAAESLLAYAARRIAEERLDPSVWGHYGLRAEPADGGVWIWDWYGVGGDMPCLTREHVEDVLADAWDAIKCSK